MACAPICRASAVPGLLLVVTVLLSDIRCRVELEINNAFEECGLKAQRIADPRDGTGLGKRPSSPDLRPVGVTPFAAFFVTPSNPSL